MILRDSLIETMIVTTLRIHSQAMALKAFIYKNLKDFFEEIKIFQHNVNLHASQYLSNSFALR